MRQIKFRGFDLLAKKWFYGSLVASAERENAIDYFIVDRQGNRHQVMRQSVGEYTGVQDVNGNEIYEGDIVETFSVFESYRQVGDYPPPNVEVSEWDYQRYVSAVKFCFGSFVIGDTPLSFGSYDGETDDEAKTQFTAMWEEDYDDMQEKYPYLTWEYFEHPHIMGNVYENKHLLEDEQ